MLVLLMLQSFAALLIVQLLFVGISDVTVIITVFDSCAILITFIYKCALTIPFLGDRTVVVVNDPAVAVCAGVSAVFFLMFSSSSCCFFNMVISSVAGQCRVFFCYLITIGWGQWPRTEGKPCTISSHSVTKWVRNLYRIKLNYIKYSCILNNFD